ncbi:MAG: polyphosphate polymerase domain-containing protein [Lachnospiraceae bacterium]|nr:polyphosphate polymerase domain-containing protein [Lachnospiraceae bacterium]
MEEKKGTYKENFARIETKYMLSRQQYDRLMKQLEDYVEPDEYGDTRIYNIYYDTPNYRLIRESIEKPTYKEKLRLRTYLVPDSESNSFVEIKKKYKGVVYKRRIGMPYGMAKAHLDTGKHFEDADEERTTQSFVDAQIGSEIDSFTDYYDALVPKMVISYDRLAFRGKEDPDFRVTFDTHITWRCDHLDLQEGGYGEELLEEGNRLMEIKCGGAIPKEVAAILSKEEIYQTSYSKYGSAYREYVKGMRVCRMATGQAKVENRKGEKGLCLNT